ncbi:MAG: hypothetical protein MI867_08880, partial [Pseudomonadales bacterium]|nr:hypothetical protein [Pseudomonadales bacterium]
MSAYWNSASFKVISFFFLTFSLLGCGASINNGQTIDDLSGGANSSKTYDVKIPENITGLLIEAKGSDSISLDLQDENENSLGACSAATRCYLTNPSAATYKLKLNASAAYSNVSLAGSWGGTEAAILINNQEITELAGDADSLLLKSIYVGLNGGAVNFTSTGLSGAILEVTDQYGEIIETCANSESCSVANLSEGLFFARILGASEFTDATLLASWGNPIDATLSNGEQKAVSGNYGDVVLESLYLQPGATAIMAHSNSRDIELQILNQDGVEIGSCESESCHASGLDSGVYFVRTRINANNTNSSIVVAWAGFGESTMDNGDYVTGLSLNTQESLLQSFYVDAANTDVLLIPSETASEVIIYNETGTMESACGMNVPCHFRSQSSGVYFVRVYNHMPDFINFGLSVAWANVTTANLFNGDKTSGLTLQSGDSLVQSFYVSEDNSFVQVIPSDISFDLMIYNANGEVISNCLSYNPCAFAAPTAASYFAVMRNYFQDPLSFSISVAWANENGGTLNNGSKSETQSLRRGEAWAQSFYVDSDNSNLLLMPSATAGEVFLYDSSGGLVTGCYGFEPCIIQVPTAGAYFVAAVNAREDLVNMSLSVAWTSATSATLANGDRSLTASLSSGETLLESFYVDTNNANVLVMPSDAVSDLLIYDNDGEIITHCASFSPCV